MLFLRRVGSLLLVAGLLGLVACASPIRTHVDRDTAANFDHYRTYAWVGPAPLARAKEGSSGPSFVSAIDDQRIRRAVDRDLQARGYRLVASPESADLVVAYSVGSEEKVRVHESPMRATVYPYPTAYRYGPWYASSTVRVQQYTEGTLTLEFYDRKTQQAVWVGWASKRLSRRDDSQEIISQAVNQVLADFPAASRR